MMLAKYIQSNSLRTVVRKQASRSMTILSKESKEEYLKNRDNRESKLNYKTKMETAGFPISPHFTIFAWPVTAISSGVNRVTGCMLTVGTFGLGTIELLGGSGASLSLMQTIGGMGTLVPFIGKFGVAFPIIYHYGGGMRHFYWDFYPETLTPKGIDQLSYGLLGGSIALAGMAALA